MASAAKKATIAVLLYSLFVDETEGAHALGIKSISYACGHSGNGYTCDVTVDATSGRRVHLGMNSDQAAAALEFLGESNPALQRDVKKIYAKRAVTGSANGGFKQSATRDEVDTVITQTSGAGCAYLTGL
ncbi:MAG: hypothetical protein AAGA53_17670 [Pseudomonadota bacterium]